MTDHLKSRTKRYLVVLSRWIIVAAFVFVATIAGGIYVTDNVLTKVYAATAVMEVEPQPANPPEETGSAFSTPQGQAVEAEFESIESPQVLQAVVTDLELDRIWAERLFKKSEPLPAEEALHHLESNLRLNFKHGTNIVEVRATSDDPKEAADIANAVVNSYKTERDLQSQSATKTAIGPVQILARATTPESPARPNKRMCYAITAGIAGLLGVMIASSVEVCMLIARAEESARDLEPVF
jgi:capsular polysaccharide biosynthesis protein